MSGPVLLSAGGTGGHLFPAEALAHELKKRGRAVYLATDRRAERFAGSFPAEEVFIVRSSDLRRRKPDRADQGRLDDLARRARGGTPRSPRSGRTR